MMNVTSRLAVKIHHLPDFEFSWSDKSPHRSRDSTTIEDILPSQDDSRVLKEHAVQFMMRFLVEAFCSLKDMNKLGLTNSPCTKIRDCTDEALV